MRYIDRRVQVPLFLVHLAWFALVFNLAFALLRDPASVIESGLIVSLFFVPILFLRYRARRRIAPGHDETPAQPEG